MPTKFSSLFKRMLWSIVSNAALRSSSTNREIQPRSDDKSRSFVTLMMWLIWSDNVNGRIMPMSDAVSSEGPKTMGIQQRSSALSLTHRDFSSFSESFDDVMHCRWWDLQSLCNLTYSTIFLRTLSQIGEPLPIFTSERLCLSKTSLFIAKPDVN